VGAPFLASDVGTATGTISAGSTLAPLQKSDGTNLPPVEATKYRILAIVITAQGPETTVTLKSASSGRSITPAHTVSTGNPLILPYNPYGWGDTDLGESFGVTTSNVDAVQISMTYGIIKVGS
jgi:hypothetical protein